MLFKLFDIDDLSSPIAVSVFAWLKSEVTSNFESFISYNLAEPAAIEY